MCAVVGDDGICGLQCSGEATGEIFTASFEPLVKHQRLEQRSRESFEKESRIGFARPKPFAHERKVELVNILPDGRTRERLLGLLAERRASRNLLLHEKCRRDVLNIQRTTLMNQIRKMRTGRTEENDFGFRGGESRKGTGLFSPLH